MRSERSSSAASADSALQQEIALLQQAIKSLLQRTLLTDEPGTLPFALIDEPASGGEAHARRKTLEERVFSSAVIDSLPGVFYSYDQHGRFLRWNRNFEQVTGYTSAEISRMHPLDFFPIAERELVAARIRETFEMGESRVETSLLSKDGRLTPHFFTGLASRFNEQPCLVGVGIDISAARRAEEARQAFDERYRALFNYATEGIAVAGRDGTIFEGNASLCRILGYSREELLGLAAPDIFGPAVMERIALAFIGTSENFDLHHDCELRRKDGSVFSGEVMPLLLTDGKLMLMIRDISARRQADEVLRRSEREQRQLAEQLEVERLRLVTAQEVAKVGSWESDIASGAVVWSDEMFHIFGLAPGEISPTHERFLESVHPDDRTAVNTAFLRSFAIHSVCEIEHRVILPDGQIKVVAERWQMFHDERGRPLRAIGTCHDITERKRADKSLRELNESLEQKVIARTAELQAALGRAEVADEAKSAFLATMSHELRTPLNSIIGFTGIILQGLAGPLNAEQTKQLGMVRGSANHLLELINDVLDISKIEAGQLNVRTSAFDLRASIAKVVDSVMPLAAKKGLALSVQVDSLPGEMLGDQRRVEQILLNLLHNAIKFTDRGHVRLVGEWVPQGSAQAAPSREMVRLSVSDTGVGIKAEDLATLFQPFRQLESGLTRHHEGTGLGLAISSRLAGLLGGSISATSEPSLGSTFTVLLPLGGTSLR